MSGAIVVRKADAITPRVDRDVLAQRIVDTVGVLAVKLKDLEDDIRVLWTEFDQLKSGESILGCATRKEFCAKYLKRTPRAVRFMLTRGAEDKSADTARRLLDGEEIISPLADLPADILELVAAGALSPSRAVQRHQLKISGKAPTPVVTGTSSANLVQASANKLPLADQFVQLVVTSPPYLNLRTYDGSQDVTWADGTTCPFGGETSVSDYVAHTIEVLQEVKRVLKDDGMVFWNICDRYLEGTKNLCLIPSRIAMAAQDDGWIVRSQIIWHKPNATPESVKDRPTASYEEILMLVKDEKYYWNPEGSQEPRVASCGQTGPVNKGKKAIVSNFGRYGDDVVASETRNIRNVWSISTQPYKGPHFAPFPEELPRRCINAASRAGDTVLDPFGGSGTTGKVALELGRNAVLCDINYGENGLYRVLAEQRIAASVPLDAGSDQSDFMLTAEDLKPSRGKPWIEFVPDFLDATRAQELLDWINTLDLKPETGNCPAKVGHDTIHFGPRQAYMKCVPEEFQVESSGPIPEYLRPLHEEMERRYQQSFNSVQINRHWNEKSVVQPHSDLMHGDIVMLSLGAPRRFVLKHKHDHKAKAPRWKTGDIYFDDVLPSGSLLTIHKQHQSDVTHEMPEASDPCGVRVSLIWRYVAEPITRKLHWSAKSDGDLEYANAQVDFAKRVRKADESAAA